MKSSFGVVAVDPSNVEMPTTANEVSKTARRPT